MKIAAACLFALVFASAARASGVHVQLQDDAGHPVSDAVVFLESPEAARLVKPLVGAQVAQEHKQFVPQVSIVTRGTEVSFPNHDKVRHQVYSFSPAKKFELKLYAGTPANPVLFDQAGVVVLGCNIHDSMVGWVLVVDTPYFGSSRAGEVLLDNVPPGAYHLRTWHAGLPVGSPALDQAVVVPAEGVAQAVVRLSGLTP